MDNYLEKLFINEAKPALSRHSGGDTDAAYEAGRKSQYDEFWDNYQEYGNRARYANAFSYDGWTDATFKPKYDIRPINRGCSYMFFCSSITDLTSLLNKQGVTLDTSKSTELVGTFNGTKLTHIPIVSAEKATALTYLFMDSTELVTIECLRLKTDGQNTFNRTFENCRELVNLTIEGVIGKNGCNVQWSTKLSHDSLMSIINALADKTADTSGTVWEVTLGSNIAKLTQEEIAIAENKGWILG